MAKENLVRLLSLDGGGIRGIITATILAALEAKLNEKYKAKNGKDPVRPLRIGQFFDLLAGTSTGGILTVALLAPHPDDPSYPRYSAQEAIDLYLKNGQFIFTKAAKARWPLGTIFFSAKYGRNNMEATLQRYFGDLRMSELIKPCLITSYDIEKRRAVFFTQHDAIRKGSMYDFYVRDVARSTSAAPTYFPPGFAESKSDLIYHTIDGGLFANNPTMCAVIESLKLFGKEDSLLNPSDMMILSIGTGTVEKQYNHAKAQKWGMVGWLNPIINIMMSAVSETVDYQLKKLYDSINRKDQYIRIMPQLFTADSEMDNVSVENLENLHQAGLSNAIKFEDTLDRVAEILLEGSTEEVPRSFMPPGA
ncbi:MAG: patatin-like phospholipase family protein [Lewinellaceae bacterium]|nr:patatin-like phospholipase family protein [Lewinellaceae bacterium]